jgi:hypothetical protein
MHASRRRPPRQMTHTHTHTHAETGSAAFLQQACGHSQHAPAAFAAPPLRPLSHQHRPCKRSLSSTRTRARWGCMHVRLVHSSHAHTAPDGSPQCWTHHTLRSTQGHVRCGNTRLAQKLTRATSARCARPAVRGTTPHPTLRQHVRLCSAPPLTTSHAVTTTAQRGCTAATGCIDVRVCARALVLERTVTTRAATACATSWEETTTTHAPAQGVGDNNTGHQHNTTRHARHTSLAQHTSNNDPTTKLRGDNEKQREQRPYTLAAPQRGTRTDAVPCARRVRCCAADCPPRKGTQWDAWPVTRDARRQASTRRARQLPGHTHWQAGTGAPRSVDTHPCPAAA